MAKKDWKAGQPHYGTPLSKANIAALKEEFSKGQQFGPWTIVGSEPTMLDDGNVYFRVRKHKETSRWMRVFQIRKEITRYKNKEST